jgi:hypothetical protein
LALVALLGTGCAKPSSNAAAAAASPGPAVLSAVQRTEALAATVPSGDIQLETLDDHGGSTRKVPALETGAEGTIYVSGWAWNEPAKKPCATVTLVEGQGTFPARYGFARPDVAAYFHDDALTRTGYLGAVAARDLGRGKHRLNVVCVTDEPGTSRRSPFTVDVSVR